MSTKFYEFSQNNSGGFFDVDENVCHRIIVEAKSSKEAVRFMEGLTENASGSCPCCGDRWYLGYPDEIDLEVWKTKGYPVSIYSHYDDPEERWEHLYGEYPTLEKPEWKKKTFKVYEGKIYFDSIEDYAQFMANEYGWTTPDVYIYYVDGTKKAINITKKKY